MGQDARQTVDEIDRTRDDLARKVDELVDLGKDVAEETGKKLAAGAGALAALLFVGYIAKRRIRS
jgi:hypothetical protein